MDSTTDKERNDYPKWPASKGPGFFSAFLLEMAAFMMRIKLYIFACPTVGQLPPEFPTGGAAAATRGATERTATEFYDIDTSVKYKQASMQAWGYLSRAVQGYAELRDAINGHLGDYVASLKAIEVYVTGSTDMQLYDLRTVKMPALFEQCRTSTEIPNLIIKVNSLNHDIGTINPAKSFPADELRERLLNLISRDHFGLKDVHRSAFLDSKLETWDGLCSHLKTIIRPEPQQHVRQDRGTALVMHRGLFCLKCGASDHPSRECTNAFKACDKCDGPQRFLHSAKFHDQATQKPHMRHVICWRCGGNHLSRNCNVPCKCDTCGKDDHSTAYHDIYDRIVNKNKKAGTVSCVMRL